MTAYGMGFAKPTFRLADSFGNFDFSYYRNGWAGNQYVTSMKLSNIGKIGGGVLSVVKIGLATRTLFDSKASSFDKWLAGGDVAFGSIGILGGLIGGSTGTVLSISSLGYGVVFVPIFLGTYNFTAPIILEKQSAGLYFPHPYVGK